ncbi:MAG: cyclase family protein [Streptosporangiales bacterium]|nr:cyclase family protein [Streptosporangiales bacterium]
MNLENLAAYLQRTKPMNRRDALGVAAKTGVALSVAGAGLSGGTAQAAARPATGNASPSPGEGDEMFDVAAVENGAWAPGPYGPDDQRGAFNEVTPAKTARALRLLDDRRPVKTYNLGDLMFNGYPAYVTTPERVYEQRLVVLGYQPPPEFFAEEGILQSPTPMGPNRISAHEERFPRSGTYQIATQLDNLAHVGVGRMFYNGFTGPEIAAGYGTTKLGGEHMGPIVTRGLVVDVLGLKVATDATGDYFVADNGEPVLNDNYRITVEDIEAALDRQGVRGPTPGDVVLFRTGWHNLVRVDPERYLANEPGIYLREARYLAKHRPAIVGGDAWALETLNEDVNQGNLFPVHQELLGRFGIRIGEGIITDALVADGVFECVYMYAPQFAKGATAANSAPAALAQPRRR